VKRSGGAGGVSGVVAWHQRVAYQLGGGMASARQSGYHLLGNIRRPANLAMLAGVWLCSKAGSLNIGLESNGVMAKTRRRRIIGSMASMWRLAAAAWPRRLIGIGVAAALIWQSLASINGAAQWLAKYGVSS